MIVNDELEVEISPASVLVLSSVVLFSHLVVLNKSLSEQGESGEPVVELLILDDHSVEILVKSSCTKLGNKNVRLVLSNSVTPHLSCSQSGDIPSCGRETRTDPRLRRKLC